MAARESGYEIVSVERWVREGAASDGPTMAMRHDVDQHPRSALTMAAIERELGVRSSWYFRWRTAHPAVIRALREDGFEIGLHYETLSRTVLRENLRSEEVDGLLEAGREKLRAEIEAFARLFGPVRSVVPHGDSRIPWINNGDLLRGQDCSDYGIEFDANEAMRGRRIAHWLTDRSSAEGGWKDEVDPRDLLARHTSPILCLTHPNNWVSGPSLWLDRILGAALPDAHGGKSGGRAFPIRTGSDTPPA